MSDIPDEILGEILSRLPVEPLLRFRCVSKSWKSLIDSQQFINHHLNHSRKTKSNLNIILRSGRHRHLYSCDFDVLNETNMATFKELSHPCDFDVLNETNMATFSYSGFAMLQILGSCDGLLVLRNDKDDVAILWNPSIRRFHEIPIEFPGEFAISFFGFGYDVGSDDYKLIRIVQSYEDMNDNELNSEGKAYSLKSDSWRMIPDFPYSIVHEQRNGVLANGALHWFVLDKVKSDTDYLVAFDLGTEESGLMPLPKFEGDDHSKRKLVVLGGCLSLMYHNVKDGNCFDIWVMKEYGVEESWSILMTFDICNCDFMTPLAFSKCGRKVLLQLDRRAVLVWCDLDEEPTDVVPMVPSVNFDEIHTCLRSLVLLNNDACDLDFFTKKKQERLFKNRSSTPRTDTFDFEDVCNLMYG